MSLHVHDCESACVYECALVCACVYECIRLRTRVYVLAYKRELCGNTMTATIRASMEAGQQVG